MMGRLGGRNKKCARRRIFLGHWRKRRDSKIPLHPAWNRHFIDAKNKIPPTMPRRFGAFL